MSEASQWAKRSLIAGFACVLLLATALCTSCSDDRETLEVGDVSVRYRSDTLTVEEGGDYGSWTAGERECSYCVATLKSADPSATVFVADVDGADASYIAESLTALLSGEAPVADLDPVLSERWQGGVAARENIQYGEITERSTEGGDVFSLESTSPLPDGDSRVNVLQWFDAGENGFGVIACAFSESDHDWGSALCEELIAETSIAA